MAQLKHYTADAPRSLSDILLFEIDQHYSRENGELAPLTEDLPLGAVLTQNEAGQYIPFGSSPAAEEPAADDKAAEPAPAAENGEGETTPKPAETAASPCAILISRHCQASEEPQPCAVIRRGAVVAAANLFWLETVSEEQKLTALAALASLGIVPKE